jgi:hypothetical protein
VETATTYKPKGIKFLLSRRAKGKEKVAQGLYTLTSQKGGRTRRKEQAYEPIRASQKGGSLEP